MEQIFISRNLFGNCRLLPEVLLRKNELVTGKRHFVRCFAFGKNPQPLLQQMLDNPVWMLYNRNFKAGVHLRAVFWLSIMF